MNPPPAYSLNGLICESSDLQLYRATRAQDGVEVLIKTPRASRPEPLLLQRLEHEFELTRDLDPALIAHPLTLEHGGDAMALVLEQGPDRTLAERLGSPMEVSTFLRIAIGITAALSEMHRHELIHKDLKPEHVLLDAGGHVWLTGLGVASRLPRERQMPEPLEVIVGTLAYMAPEQTGRMNRSIDSRSDLYALGITFYQMLTGVLPFAADDPMGWVHCHIARQAVPPNQRVPNIPEPLSAMVMKLLAKTAEDRYQSTAGLDADLRHCLVQWESTGRIEPFAMASHDVSERLLIPEKLYGRQAEMDILLTAFNQAVISGIPRFVAVSGYSGVGKTAVVHELHKAMVSPRGLFAEGKFDQYKRDIPYATLVQALQTLVRQVLGKSEAEVAVWRDAIEQAVSPNGQLIVNLIPEVELIIGPQLPVPELPSQEAQSRFQRVLRRFLGVFARAEHPLTLFLDDLQWLDAATLALIEQLVTGQDVRHLLLIGAYRDNEVGPAHPLMRTLDTLRKDALVVREIMLGPLSIADVCSLVADTLHCDQQRALPLAQLVYEKTGGNPFFANQFLTELAKEKLLVFQLSEGRWTWNLARIHAKGYTDNVVDLMVAMLGRLPAHTLEVLKRFACLGNAADIATLTTVCGQAPLALHAALWKAVQAGLVLRSGDDYAFLHDRVQEAAYSLIPGDERSVIHLRIGRSLASEATPQQIQEKVFGIVGQFNRATELISAPQERERIAELNLIAGRQAKDSTAYASALKYLTAGQALLVPDTGKRCYELSFELGILRAECEFLTGDLVAAEARMATLSEQAGNLVDSARVTSLRVNLFTTLDRSDRSIEVTLDYLQRLGIHWSAHPSKEDVIQEFEQIWQQLGSRAIETLADLPLMRDPRWRVTMDVLTTALNPALFTDQNLLGLMVGRMVNLSLAHGNSDGSPIGYAFLAMFLGPSFDDYAAGSRFAQLAVDLVERPGVDRFKARVYLHVANVVNPWMRHFDASTGLIRRAFATANETGDLSYAAYSCNHLITNLLALGAPLEEVQHEAEIGLGFVLKARFGLVVDILIGQLGLIRALRGLESGFSINGETFDEKSFERNLTEDPHLAIAKCWYWIRKLQERFFAGDYPAAVQAGSEARRLLWTSPSHIELAEYHFYGALARSALCDTTTAGDHAPHLAALVEHHEQLVEWAEHCPQNFANRVLLVAAEIARIEDRVLDAERLYEQAIQSARENGFVHNEGIANEVTAKFYLRRGFETIARAYLREAGYCYGRWGAQGKLKQLAQDHSKLWEQPSLAPIGTISTDAQALDIQTIIQASQAISVEIFLDNLLKTLMGIVLENAGAQHGYLLLARNNELVLAAAARVEQQNIVMHVQGEPGFSEDALPASILNYVRRSREPVLLDDASSPNPYSADEYFLRQHPKSVLCVPITKQATLIGLLYLENDLATHAFTAERLTVLELLAAQAAISLENALVYDALQESEERLRLTMEASQIGIWDWDVKQDSWRASPTYDTMLGYPPNDAPRGRSQWMDWLHPDDRNVCIGKMQEVVSPGFKGFEYEARMRHADGTYRWEHIKGFGVKRDSQGKVTRLLGIRMDITERKKAEEALRQLNQELDLRVAMRTAELQAANKELEAFSYSVSHDLRSPLRHISGYLTLLKEHAAPMLDEESLQHIEKAVHSTRRTGALIDDLLSFSRMGRQEMGNASVDLNTLVADVVRELAPDAEGRDIDWHIAPNLPVMVGDRSMLRVVLVNLISNALKYTSKRAQTRIEIGALAGEKGETVVFIRDNGAGFDMRYSDKLFGVFQRLHRIDEFHGTGIGLANVFRIISRHGGRTWAEGKVDVGATFYFSLPNKKT